jgi:hypothetical protein
MDGGRQGGSGVDVIGFACVVLGHGTRVWVEIVCKRMVACHMHRIWNIACVGRD